MLPSKNRIQQFFLQVTNFFRAAGQRLASFLGPIQPLAKKAWAHRSTRKFVRFGKRYSAQLGFTLLVAVFLMISVGEGQASDPMNPTTLAAALSSTQSNGFFGKPQILSDQTVTTGEVQQQIGIIYQVAAGDSIISIASRYNLSPGTIIDANKINATTADQIQPGKQLLIPAVDTNTSLDWLSAINTQKAEEAAQAEAQYKAQLAAAAKAKANKTSSAAQRGTPAGTTVNGVLYLGTQWGSYNGGDPGQCTWYVNSARHFPGPMGNAGQYLASARSYGLATGSVPQIGAVVVTRESFYGHVGIVVGISANSVTIKEMNYLGPGKIDERSISATSGLIKGYVY